MLLLFKIDSYQQQELSVVNNAKKNFGANVESFKSIIKHTVTQLNFLSSINAVVEKIMCANG